MGTKQDVIRAIFDVCKQKGEFVFHNDFVKAICKEIGFGNPFDATKIDNSSLLPQNVRDENYFIAHLGVGYHAFFKGVELGYHHLETISPSENYTWKYRQSLLNEFDTSESNILSVASNQRIIHDFLYNDIVASPKVYNARRTKASFSYWVGEQQIECKNLQMEIDLTLEYQGVVTVFEGKNGFPDDFAIYQLFNPFKYYTQLKEDKNIPIQQITCCYVLREKQESGSIIRLYNYTFEDPNQIASIRLVKKSQYNLIKR